MKAKHLYVPYAGETIAIIKSVVADIVSYATVARNGTRTVRGLVGKRRKRRR